MWTHLVFSPDGGRLAAGLSAVGYGSTPGITAGTRWRATRTMAAQSMAPTLRPTAGWPPRLYDGKVRLYAPGAAGAVRPAVAVDAPGGKSRIGIAFSPPDGARLAVGYIDTRAVDLLDGQYPRRAAALPT